MNKFAVAATDSAYRYILKPLLFKVDPETVHEKMTTFGEGLGSISITRSLMQSLYQLRDERLAQNIAGINFASPIGLSAGFDYEAKITQITPALGFGFHTVGTITNNPYGGNPKPMLGRLPKSNSLMVNKGFKNPGAKAVIEKLTRLNFSIPVGISIGRTNDASLSQKDSVKDIISAFTLFEESKVKHLYYELNISCPNLFGDISFYPPANLKELLKEIDRLKIKKPIFIKMPIDKTDKETKEMLEVITKFNIKGVIFGNLQKDRNHPALDPQEVSMFEKGNFSGKPTYDRSNELITLAYKLYKQKLVIIGCGGVFTVDDAYRKMTLGASLVQMITGMIFKGPQLIAKLNTGLLYKINKGGAKNISEIIGSAVK